MAIVWRSRACSLKLPREDGGEWLGGNLPAALSASCALHCALAVTPQRVVLDAQKSREAESRAVHSPDSPLPSRFSGRAKRQKLRPIATKSDQIRPKENYRERFFHAPPSLTDGKRGSIRLAVRPPPKPGQDAVNLAYLHLIALN
jgi:hypothetical protein